MEGRGHTICLLFLIRKQSDGQLLSKRYFPQIYQIFVYTIQNFLYNEIYTRIQFYLCPVCHKCEVGNCLIENVEILFTKAVRGKLAKDFVVLALNVSVYVCV